MFDEILAELRSLKEKYPNTFEKRMNRVFRAMKHGTLDYRFYDSRYSDRKGGACFYNKFCYGDVNKAEKTSEKMQELGHLIYSWLCSFTPIEKSGLDDSELTNHMLESAYNIILNGDQTSTGQ